MPSQPQVLIVGAGPTGLVLALWLERRGAVPAGRQEPGPGEASRAMAVQARTLEFYRQLGIADEVVAAGFRLDRLHLRNRPRRARVVRLGDVGAGHQPVPVRPQPPPGRPRAAADRAPRARPATPSSGTPSCAGFTQRGRGVRATLRKPGGEETLGRRVPVRLRRRAQRRARTGWASASRAGPTTSLFYVADAEAAGAVVRPRLHRLHRRADVLPGLPGPDAGHVPVHRPRPPEARGPRRPRIRRPPRRGRAGDGDAGRRG